MEEATLVKFLNGTASKRDETEVLKWLKKPESRKEFDLVLEKYFENPAPQLVDDTDYDRLLDSIHQKMTPNKPEPGQRFIPLMYRSLRIAASIVLCVFLGYVMVQSFNHKKDLGKSKAVAEISTTVRSTGPGEKLTLLMSDKTKITVNAQSEISFDSDYGRNDRVVRIKGEAYFEVASDPNKPFQVVSDEITTTALGTEFNVFTRENEIKVALIEGKVAVQKADQTIELTPGLMASSVSKTVKGQPFSIEKFDQNRTLAWKQSELIFEKKPLGEILNDLEEWYSVSIQADKEIDLNNRLIGSYTNKSLEDILTGLSFSLDFNFTIDGKNVQLTTKNP